MTEPVNEGEEIAEYASEKDDGGAEPKLNRKGSILSPMKGAFNGEDSGERGDLKISRKESLKD